MIKNYYFGSFRAVVYWNPGQELDDIALKKLHHRLLMVNDKSGSNIKHKMLEKGSSIECIRKHFGHSIVSEFFMEQESTAFLISPILSDGNNPFLHIGLMVVEKNPGANLMRLLFLGNLCMAYEKMGNFYITNISSTPSAIENFSEIILGAWPGPDVGLKKAPPGLKQIVQKLKSDYIENYFPDPEKIVMDYKRFILTSNSQEMGFSTDFHKVSCADNFKYNIFCHTWINYDREEDVVQVGKVNRYIYLRTQLIFWFLKRRFKKLGHKSKVKNQEKNYSIQEEKKAA